MSALSLVISPAGSIARLNYILLSGLFSSLNFGLVALLFITDRLEGSFLQLASANPISLWAQFPIVGTVILFSVWVQTCLVFKRSMDFSHSHVFAWAFVGFWLGPVFAPVIFPELASITNLRVGGGIIAAVLGLMFFFKGSLPKESGTVSQSLAGDLGEAGLGDLAESTDLVARAQALRQADQRAAMALAPKAEPTPSTDRPKSFGKRNPSFATMR